MGHVDTINQIKGFYALGQSGRNDQCDVGFSCALIVAKFGYRRDLVDERPWNIDAFADNAFAAIESHSFSFCWSRLEPLVRDRHSERDAGVGYLRKKAVLGMDTRAFSSNRIWHP